MGQVTALHTSFSNGILFFFFLCFQHSNSSGPGADSPFLGSWVMLIHHWPVLSHYGMLTLAFVFPASPAATPCCSPFISLLVLWMCGHFLALAASITRGGCINN